MIHLIPAHFNLRHYTKKLLYWRRKGINGPSQFLFYGFILIIGLIGLV